MSNCVYCSSNSDNKDLFYSILFCYNDMYDINIRNSSKRYMEYHVCVHLSQNEVTIQLLYRFIFNGRNDFLKLSFYGTEVESV